MAYRQPIFMVEHAAATLSISDIETKVIGLDDDGERALIDFRSAEPAVFLIAAFGHFVRLDFPAAIAFDRLFIPAGHNFDGATIQITSDVVDTFASLTSRYNAAAPAGIIDVPMDNPTLAEQFWRISWPTSKQWELGELWFGNRFQLAADSYVGHGWKIGYQSPIERRDFGTRRAATTLGPPRRKFTLDIRNLDPAGSDFAFLDSLAQTGLATPFLYWPPDDSEPGPFIVTLDSDLAPVQEFTDPLNRILYRVSLSMTEESG